MATFKESLDPSRRECIAFAKASSTAEDAREGTLSGIKKHIGRERVLHALSAIQYEYFDNDEFHGECPTRALAHIVELLVRNEI